MGVLAPHGARGTHNSSDRRTAASEHPSAASPTLHLPRCLGGNSGKGPGVLPTLPAGGQHHVPSVPSAPWGKGIAAQLRPQGLRGPGPGGRSPQNIPPGPRRALGLTCQEQTRSHVKSPKAGYRITTSHVYFKEEAHLPEAPKSQHQGPGEHFGGADGLPRPQPHVPQSTSREALQPHCSKASTLSSIRLSSRAPQNLLPAFCGVALLPWQTCSFLLGLPGVKPRFPVQKLGFPCRNPPSSS